MPTGMSLKPLGVLLIIVGLALLYHYHQTSQTFGFRLANAIGDKHTILGVALDGLAGVILAVAGCLMLGKRSRKP